MVTKKTEEVVAVTDAAATAVETTAVETTAGSAVAVTGGAPLPAFMDMADFGTGFEGTDTESFAIPFLQILQKMSPMCDEDEAAYVEGAKAGMIYNTVTQELMDGKEGIILIPCAYKRSFIKWGGRESTEPGFKGEFTPGEVDKMIADGAIIEHEYMLLAPNKDGEIHEKKSDRFVDTRSHFVLVVRPDGSTIQAILSLASTQVKASKMLMMALNQKKVDTPQGKLTPPTFANLVKMTTKGQSNAKGAWSGAVFELDGMVTDPKIYAEAKAFHADIVAGAIAADYSKATDGGQTEEEAKSF